MLGIYTVADATKQNTSKNYWTLIDKIRILRLRRKKEAGSDGKHLKSQLLGMLSLGIKRYDGVCAEK